MSIVKEIQDALAVLSIPEKAEFLPRFFKTGKGEYGEGDFFLGLVYFFDFATSQVRCGLRQRGACQ